MAFRVVIQGVPIEADNLEEVEILLRRFGRTASEKASPMESPDTVSESVARVAPNLFGEPNDGDRIPHRKIRGIKVQSKSKIEAATKLFRSLRVESQVVGLRFLAKRGDQGADVEELREAAGTSPGHRMSGFTSGIVRRCEAFGLEPEDVLIVRYIGTVGDSRIYRYRIGPEMLAAIREMDSERFG